MATSYKFKRHQPNRFHQSSPISILSFTNVLLCISTDERSQGLACSVWLHRSYNTLSLFYCHSPEAAFIAYYESDTFPSCDCNELSWSILKASLLFYCIWQLCKTNTGLLEAAALADLVLGPILNFHKFQLQQLHCGCIANRQAWPSMHLRCLLESIIKEIQPLYKFVQSPRYRKVWIVSYIQSAHVWLVSILWLVMQYKSWKTCHIITASETTDFTLGT